MSQVNLNELWLRFVEGQELSEKQQIQLSEYLSTERSLRRQMVDERVVESMLGLMASDPARDEAFVRRCVQDFERQQFAEDSSPVAATEQASVADTVISQPIIPANVDNAAPAPDCDRPIIEISSDNHRRERQPRSARQWVRLAAAALILGPVAGAVWLVSAFWLPSSAPEQAQRQGQTDAQQQKQDASPKSTDALDLAADRFEKDLESKMRSLANSDLPSVDRDLESKRAREPEIVLPLEGNSQASKIDGRGTNRPPTFASVRAEPNCVWRSGPQGARIGSTRLALEQGRAQIGFDEGATIDLVGPGEIEITSDREVYVHQGHILAQIPPDISKFTIRSSTSEFETPDRLVLQVNVAQDGTTEALVDDGAVQLRCWSDRGELAQLKLDREKMNQVVVGSQPKELSSPAICMARGINGDFLGLVDVNGQPVELSSPEAFMQLIDGTSQGLNGSPDQFLGQWEKLFRQFRDSATSGRNEANGQPAPIQSLQDLFRTPQAMLEIFPGGNSSGAFQGVININGQEQRFESLEEFQRARAAMFGPWLGPFTDGGNSSSAFQGAININGDIMRFTSPELFRRALGNRGR